MPNLNANPKSHRRAKEAVKDRRGRMQEKASTFHVSRMAAKETTNTMPRRPRTAPEILSAMDREAFSIKKTTMDRETETMSIRSRNRFHQLPQELPRLTKLLLNVSVLGVVGSVQVIISAELTVGDLIATTVKQYIKDRRRPILPTTDAYNFDLHYSQFNLESKSIFAILIYIETVHYLIG